MKTRRQRRATSLVEVMSVMTVISLVITGLSVCIARIGKLDREIRETADGQRTRHQQLSQLRRDAHQAVEATIAGDRLTLRFDFGDPAVYAATTVAAALRSAADSSGKETDSGGAGPRWQQARDRIELHGDDSEVLSVALGIGTLRHWQTRVALPTIDLLPPLEEAP